MNKGLKALKKASPEAYARIMGMDKKEMTKMAEKGMKVIKQYFSGGVVPHAQFTPIGMQAQQRAGMQNFVNAAANAEINRKKKEEKIKTPKPEDVQEMNSMTIAEVPGAMDNDGLRASGAAPGLMTGGPSAGPAKMTIPRSGTGGSGMGQLEMGGGMSPMMMSEGGKYAENGKKNGEDKDDNVSPTEALERLARSMPNTLVTGSTADTARPTASLLDQPMGFTTAVDNTATPIQGIFIPPGDPAPEEPATGRAPSRMTPMKSRGPGLPQSGIPKELMGGIREIQTPEGPKYTFATTGGYGMTPESGHIAGSGSSGANYDSSRAGQPGGLRLIPNPGEGPRTGYDLFYLPGATGVPEFGDTPTSIRTLPSGREDVTGGDRSIDSAGYKNITDIYDLYGEEAYMDALAQLQKKGVDIDKFDLPIEFDRQPRLVGKTPSQGSVLKSRATRSTDGRVVSGTGRLGDPAFTGGTSKMAREGRLGAGQRELLDYFTRQAQFAKERYGPNSPESREAEDLIAQNFGGGGKMYGGGGMRPLKSYG